MNKVLDRPTGAFFQQIYTDNMLNLLFTLIFLKSFILFLSVCAFTMNGLKNQQQQQMKQ